MKPLDTVRKGIGKAFECFHNEIPKSFDSALISSSSTSASEIIQDDTLTYSVTKVEMWHFNIAALPRNTLSSIRLTV